MAEVEEWGCGEPAAAVSGESRLAEGPTVQVTQGSVLDAPGASVSPSGCSLDQRRLTSETQGSVAWGCGTLERGGGRL